jgi:hypothetical protein
MHVKVKLSLYQVMEAHRVVRRRGSHVSGHEGPQKDSAMF